MQTDRQPQLQTPPAPPAAMRVLYVMHHHDVSGAEILQAPVIAADADALVACPPGSRTEEFATGLGAATVGLTFRTLRHSGGILETLRSLGRGLAGARELRAVLRRHPDRQVVYCVSLRAGLLAGVAMLGMGRTAVWTMPDLMPPTPIRQLARLLARVSCRRAIALSEVIARDFAGRSRTLRRRTQVINPGVDVSRFASVPGGPRSPKVAIVGQVAPNKRLDVALDAAAIVAGQVPGFELVVVGRAQYRDSDFAHERELHRRVESDQTLRRHVRFLGRTSDVAEMLAGCAALLHCRTDEPFGMVLVEAMAAGLPVVAPASAGPAEIVEDGATGYLYEPGQASAAAARLVELLTSPELAQRLGSAARAAAERRFSAERQVAQVRQAIAAAVTPR